MNGFSVAFMENTEVGVFQFVSEFHTLPEVFCDEESAERRVEELDRAEKADKYFVW
jgi:hypothetical protein